MRPHCVICGTFVSRRPHPKTWQSEYRAVRAPRDGEQNSFLTGVGFLRHEDRLSVPSNPNQRYDDEGYQESPLDIIPFYREEDGRPLPGFLFHETCWTLLKALVYPQKVPIDRIYRICHSFSFLESGQLIWPHSYGGLVMPDPVHVLPPWMEDFPSAIRPRSGYYEYSYSYCNENPLSIPWLIYLLKDPTAATAPRETKMVSAVPNYVHDCFHCLPIELRETIQNILQSDDVTNLRLSSRSFACILLSQAFWKSRFQYGFERNHIFEVIRSHSPKDWRGWYHSTRILQFQGGIGYRSGGCDFAMLHHAEAMKNRQRIWNCSLPLAELLTLHPLETKNSDKMAEHKHIVWRMVGFREITHVFLNIFNRRAFYEDTIRMPLKISQLSISLITFNEAQYVSGFRIRSLEGNEILLGYIYPGKEVALDIGLKDDEVSALTGFVVAINTAGVKAVRAVMENGHMSQWAGGHRHFPRTTRLCMNERITHLKAGFDGFKMFSLYVPEEEPIFDAMPKLPIRKSGLWYPDIPSNQKIVHKFISLTPESPKDEYRPLVYLDFGGLRGSRLITLTKISVATQDIFLSLMEFHHGTSPPPANHKHIYPPSSSQPLRSQPTITHDIDGPGGERLIGIRVKDVSNVQYGEILGITGIQLFTNKGRSIDFEPNMIPCIKSPSRQQTPMLRRMDVDSGTTITGLYAQYVCLDPLDAEYPNVMIGIGMIAEKTSSLDTRLIDDI